jgi:uncharacterized protein (DUF2336 family)
MKNAEMKLVSEVREAVSNGSFTQRTAMLRHVTDLFVVEAIHLSDEEIELFDDVIRGLTVEIEVSARALLAIRLAPIANAPPRTIRTLAFDDAIEVAAPVLCQSQRLTDADLVENARCKGQGHMLAISQRSQLSEAVTDVLVARGDQQVVISTVNNSGAELSTTSFAMLVQRAGGNDELAGSIARRPDIPAPLFRELLKKASLAVRQKLEATHPEFRRQVREAVDEVSKRLEERVLTQSAAISEDVLVNGNVTELKLESDDQRLRGVVSRGAAEDVVLVLADMSDLPVSYIQKLMGERRPDSLLILARALKLSWPTVKMILASRRDRHTLSEFEIGQGLASYEKLSFESAREILRFYRMRERDNPSPL